MAIRASFLSSPGRAVIGRPGTPRLERHLETSTSGNVMGWDIWDMGWKQLLNTETS